MFLSTEHLQNAFQWTWQTSTQASIFVGLILITLFIWGRHFSPGWRMAFGLMILIRLVLPVLPESSFSYLNFIPSEKSKLVYAHQHNVITPQSKLFQIGEWKAPVTNPPQTTAIEFIPALVANPVIAPFSNSIITNKEARPAAESPFVYPSMLTSLSILWVLGMTFMILGTYFRRFNLLRHTKNQTSLTEDSIPATILSNCQKELGIHRTIQIIPSCRIQTAAVFGFLRPVILVSPQLDEKFNEAEIRDILLHELAHIQRADILWNWLAFAAQTLHWFNPLVWIAARRFRSDRELACDARVLNHLSPKQRTQYGNTLIKIAALHSRNPSDLNPSLAPFNHHQSEIKTRITMIAKPKKLTPLTHVILTLTLVIVCSITFTRAQEEETRKRREVVERKEVNNRGRERDRPAGRNEVARRDGDRDHPNPERAERAKRDDHPERGEGPPHPPERGGRPPHPPEGRGHNDMPPDAKKFVEQVKDFHREIGNLMRAGNGEAAHDVQNELKKFIQNHAELARRVGPAIHGPERSHEHHSDHDRGRERHRPSPQEQLKKLHHALEGAEKEGRHEQAEQLRHHIEEIENHLERGREGPGNGAHEIERKIRHLHAAAENLEQAGLGEAADKILQQAEDIENEFRERMEREERHHHERHIENQERQIDHQEKQIDRQEKHIDNQERQIDHQEKQIDQLRKEVEQLRKELRKKD